ncbi:MAG: hypothetical protein ACQERZ_05385 [Fusobacteriota bacterium]
MKLNEAVKTVLEENGEIYLDKTKGWYEQGGEDHRTGGEDIIYAKKKLHIKKIWDYVDENGEIKKDKKNITVDEIVKELENENVNAEEVMLGAIINRGMWESRQKSDH